MKPFRPMLAADADLANLRFPVMASPKLDGVRAIVRDGVVYSRSSKPIPNRFVQKIFGCLNYYDGELIVGLPTAPDCYRTTMSGVMTESGEPDVYFHAFDHILDPNHPFSYRFSWLSKVAGETVYPAITRARIKIVYHQTVRNIQELENIEVHSLKLGYEGLILRDPTAPYKEGRSTVGQGWMLKLKRFKDGEFEVIGFEERYHNMNEAKTNELGYTSHSHHKAGQVPAGDLGALILRFNGNDSFRCGTGFSASDRTMIWNNRKHYLGKIAKVKFFEIGIKDKPRHPVFLGFRSTEDL